MSKMHINVKTKSLPNERTTAGVADRFFHDSTIQGLEWYSQKVREWNEAAAFHKVVFNEPSILGLGYSDHYSPDISGPVFHNSFQE